MPLGQALPRQVDPPLFQELLFVFPVRTGTNQPKDHRRSLAVQLPRFFGQVLDLVVGLLDRGLVAGLAGTGAQLIEALFPLGRLLFLGKSLVAEGLLQATRSLIS